MIKIDKHDIARAIRIVAKTCGTDGITEGIFMKSHEGTMWLTSRKSDIQSYVKIPCTGTDEVYFVPGRQFYNIISAAVSMPNLTELVLESENGTLRIRADGIIDACIPLKNTDYFTPLDSMILSKGNFKIDSKFIKSMVKKVAFSASTDNSKPTLKGIYFEATDDSLKATAVDGYRFAHTECEIKFEGKGEFLLPSTSIASIADEFVGDVEINIGSNVVTFFSGGVKFIIRCIEENFVDYQKYIPSKFDTLFKMSRKELKASLRNIGAVIKGQECIIIRKNTSGVQLLNKDKTISISLNGEWQGSDMEIAFNIKYLKTIPGEGDEIVFNFQNPLSPCVIKDSSDVRNFYLVLPMKI